VMVLSGILETAGRDGRGCCGGGGYHEIRNLQVEECKQVLDLSSVTFSAASCRFQSRLSRTGLIYSQKNRSNR